MSKVCHFYPSIANTLVQRAIVCNLATIVASKVVFLLVFYLVPLQSVPTRYAELVFFKKINLFIYLFLAALGLCCCVRAFSSCGEWGLFSVAVHGLLITVASLVVEHGV